MDGISFGVCLVKLREFFIKGSFLSDNRMVIDISIFGLFYRKFRILIFCFFFL